MIGIFEDAVVVEVRYPEVAGGVEGNALRTIEGGGGGADAVAGKAWLADDEGCCFVCGEWRVVFEDALIAVVSYPEVAGGVEGERGGRLWCWRRCLARCW